MKPSSITEKVRYTEVDQMGIVHHSRYAPWFEIGRLNYLDSCGLDYSALEKEGYRLVVMNLSINYLKPLRFSDSFKVITTPTRVSPLKINFTYEIKNEAGDLCCTGETLLGSINDMGRPFPLKKQIIAAITEGPN